MASVQACSWVSLREDSGRVVTGGGSGVRHTYLQSQPSGLLPACDRGVFLTSLSLSFLIY